MEQILFLGLSYLRAFEKWGTNLPLGILAVVYIIIRRKRGDSSRMVAWMGMMLLLLFTVPGVSLAMEWLCGFDRGRNWNEFFPIALLVGIAFDELHHMVALHGWRKHIGLLALLLLIPMGLTVGDQWTLDNISRHKNISGACERTQALCSMLHDLYGSEDLMVVLPPEFQKDVEIEDLGVHCPNVDWHVTDNNVVNYIVAAREAHAPILVIPMEVASEDLGALSGNGVYQEATFGHYVIYQYYLLDQ